MPSLIHRARAAFRAFTAKQQPARRGYDGIKTGRLYADWFANATSSDTEIRNSIRKLIDRSRDLERNNDYQRGFLFATERNVLGAVRNDLRMDAGEYVYPKGKPPVWEKDRVANSAIETAWIEWGKKGTCTICGRYSWRDVKRMVVRAVPRDGNIIIRKIRNASNRFGFALQIWEIDHLDLDKFETLKNGGQIRFGVESDQYGRPVAYHLKGAHPGDIFNGTISRAAMTSIRVPADDVYHLYMAERSEQTIGVPWIISAITRLRQLGAFEEAATIAARLGASKAGFLKQMPGPNGEVGEFTGGTSDSGNPIMEAAPGTFEALPMGWDLASWQPEYPNIETGDFRKAMLRGVATSLGMSYTTLGNDLESVNFSSARVGLFEEREGWKSLQSWFTENLWEVIFADWLEASLLNRAINLPVAKFAKFNRPLFKSRRWPFIKPGEEIEAAQKAIALRLTSRSQVIEENGGDRDDVFLDNLADEEFADEIGLSLQPADPMPEAFGDASKMPAGETDKPDDSGDDDEDDAKAKVKVGRNHVNVTVQAQKSHQAPAPQAPIIVSPPTVNITIPPAPEREQTPPTIVMHAQPIVGRESAVVQRDPKTGAITSITKTTKSEATSRFNIGKDSAGNTTLIPIPDENRN